MTDDVELTDAQAQLVSFLYEDDAIALAAVDGDDLAVLIRHRLARILDDGAGFETVELTMQGRRYVEDNW
jgi:hypothetical protein